MDGLVDLTEFKVVTIEPLKDNILNGLAIVEVTPFESLTSLTGGDFEGLMEAEAAPFESWEDKALTPIGVDSLDGFW